MIWDKLNGSNDQYDAEIAIMPFTNEVRTVYYMWSGMMQGKVCSSNIVEAYKQQGNKKLNERRIHETQKPVKLYKWILNRYAEKGNKILDTNTGSGSLAIACMDLNYDFVGCDIDRDYYISSMKRIAEHKQQTIINFQL